MTNISVSEINSYLQCRRAWDLTSANRQSLRHKVTPKIYFVIGSAIHEAIDAQARGDDPYEAFEEYVSKERAERRQAYEENVGTAAWDTEMEEFDNAALLARSLVRQYFAHYGSENPLAELGLHYIATEVPFSIPIRSEMNFVGTFDGIAANEDETTFYLVENKTYEQKPDLSLVESTNQFQGYNWAFRTLTGQTPAGTLYNGIAKQLIKEPKVLKTGALSVDKSQRITYKGFIDAINRGNYDVAKYADYIAFLYEREQAGDERFFLREMFTYSNRQLDHWYETCLSPLAYELNGIINETHGAAQIYPNFTSCRGCLVSDICNAMQRGDDVGEIKRSRYGVKTYGTVEAVTGITPTAVTSSQDIIELLRNSSGGSND